jgi:Ran GTPase-activating protein (RanGAP) involved in mRNA processing and transport
LLSEGGNDIGDVGAVAIAKALKKNIFIEKLDLSENSIEDEGASAISRALEENKTIRELNLSKANKLMRIGVNKIKYKGGEEIAVALKKNTQLALLCMGN